MKLHRWTDDSWRCSTGQFLVVGCFPFFFCVVHLLVVVCCSFRQQKVCSPQPTWFLANHAGGVEWHFFCFRLYHCTNPCTLCALCSAIAVFFHHITANRVLSSSSERMREIREVERWWRRWFRCDVVFTEPNIESARAILINQLASFSASK